jgi:predicted deacylase
MLDTLVFDGKKKGPAFLVLGAIHGNEKCGTQGIGRAVMELRSGIFALTSGSLTCAPICNPAAYAQNRRMTEVNLNRVICKNGAPARYEEKIAQHIVTLIEEADIVLDLHSYSQGARPFLFLDNDTPENRAFAAALDIPYWVTGWDDVYAQKQDLNAGDTMSFAKQAGKTGLLIECGTHDDPAAVQIAYQSLRAALAHFRMAEPFTRTPPRKPQVNRMTHILVKEQDGEFVKDWQHLDPVQKGETVLTHADGSAYAAPSDGVILLPNPRAEIGDEWIYFGVEAE